jgi:hypothetical protein
METTKMRKLVVISSVVFLVCFSCFCQPQIAYATIRIVAYNTANNPDNATEDAWFNAIFSAIGEEEISGVAKRLDILAVSETDPDSATRLVNILNTLYNVDTYDVNTSSHVGGDRTGVVYDTSTLMLLDSNDLTNIGTHPMLRAHFRPVGYTSPDSEFYVYAIHLKAGDSLNEKNQRATEAANLRSDADALGEGKHIIFAGDFNLLGSSEGAWSNMRAPGNGQAFDVNDCPFDANDCLCDVNCPCEWRDNEIYKIIHTQSTREDPCRGMAGGGMDDRFDFQLVTGEFFDGEGPEYVPGSFHVFGNNGTHNMNSWISSGNGASPEVLAALENTSDHLPIVADYVIEPICVDPPATDLNDDCRVDMLDVAMLVSEWLKCGLEPPEACWE